MTADSPIAVHDASAARGPAGRVCDALASEADRLALYRAIAAIVGHGMRGSSRDQIAQRVEEVFNETALRALGHADGLRPDHAPVPWQVGIAKNVVRGDARAGASRSRRIVSIEGDDPAWDRLKSTLAAISTADARMDVEALLARLKPASRLAIESGYLRGLSGQELADALGAPSIGAAKVRVTRAKQELLDLFAPTGSEVTR